MDKMALVHYKICHLLANSFCNSAGHFKQRMYFVKSHSLLYSAVTDYGRELTHNEFILLLQVAPYQKNMDSLCWQMASREAQAVRPGILKVYVIYW